MDRERFERFVEAQVNNNGMSSGTARKYRSAVDALSEWRDGAGEVTVEEMEDFLLAKATEDQSNGSTLNVYKCAFGKYLASVSRSSDYQELKLWFKNNFSATSGGTPDYLTREEAEAVREAASEDARDAAMVAIFIRTGIRVGELVDLDVSDISRTDDEGEVTVRRQKRRKRIEQTRGLTEEDMDAIGVYLDQREEYGPDSGTLGAALFVNSRENDDGTHRVTPGYVRGLVSDIGERADHPDVTRERLHPHLFRHTVGTWLGQEGYNAMEIGDYLGKETGAERYVHFDDELASEMSDALV